MLGKYANGHMHSAGATVFGLFVFVVCSVWLLLFAFSQPARAAVNWSGYISPRIPTYWTSSTTARIGGGHNAGTLDITDGSDIVDKVCEIYSGQATVDGDGSTWTHKSALYIRSDGLLNISNSGEVRVAETTWLDHDSDSPGAINFDGGTLTTDILFCNSDDLTGTGTINTHGLVSDVDLVFDATRFHPTFNIANNPEQNITVNLNVDGSTALGAGYSGVGTMRIADGRLITSKNGYIGYQSGSEGEVNVSGYVPWQFPQYNGSHWINEENLYIGYSGSGLLTISDGGVVQQYSGYLGYNSGSTGTAIVDGAGATMTNEELYVGHYGHGSLTISDGSVASENGYIGYSSGSVGTAFVDGPGATLKNEDLYVGHSGNGSLTISDGSVVQQYYGYIGYHSGSTGTVTVNEATWRNSGDLYVGKSGHGTLQIDHGRVWVEGNTFVSHDPGSLGKINFDGGTLTTGGLFCAADDLMGTGTINTGGLISDVDLVFDATHPWYQVIHIANSPGQNITVNLNAYDSAILGIGYRSTGTMRIADGRCIRSLLGCIGYKAGSEGEVNVGGYGSKWINERALYVGFEGDGVLNVSDGGNVDSDRIYIGRAVGSEGEVNVSGPDATLTSETKLFVGFEGNGTMNITGGGRVSNALGYITGGYDSTGEVTVAGEGSAWMNSVRLYVGNWGSGMLTISDGGLVSVAGKLSIDEDNDGHDCISMSSGGMLALGGDADESLDEFLDLILGSDAIRYWDDSLADWADITSATRDDDYTLCYHSGGELAGYTVLSVGTVPEPSALVGLLGMAIAGLLARGVSKSQRNRPAARSSYGTMMVPSRSGSIKCSKTTRSK